MYVAKSRGDAQIGFFSPPVQEPVQEPEQQPEQPVE